MIELITLILGIVGLMITLSMILVIIGILLGWNIWNQFFNIKENELGEFEE